MERNKSRELKRKTPGPEIHFENGAVDQRKRGNRAFGVGFLRDPQSDDCTGRIKSEPSDLPKRHL